MVFVTIGGTIKLDFRASSWPKFVHDCYRMKPARRMTIALCGPSDVMSELRIAREVIAEWNQSNSTKGAFVLHPRHWVTSSHPDLSERPQGVINRQIIDTSDIIVAAFWSRLGTPTGLAESGTEEEIQRAVVLRKAVMVYFSDRRPFPSGHKLEEVERLHRFEEKCKQAGLISRFKSRSEFRLLFGTHLAIVMNKLAANISEGKETTPNMDIKGNNNLQAGRDINFYAKPPVMKNIIERRPGSVTPAELRQIAAWIEELAEGAIGKTRQPSYAEWGARLKKRFNVSNRAEIRWEQMPEVEAWFTQQRAIQTRGKRRKAPQGWRESRIKAIKSAMASMGVKNEDYYPRVADRLGMKAPFETLKDLTDCDLERVYTMTLRDQRAR